MSIDQQLAASIAKNEEREALWGRRLKRLTRGSRFDGAIWVDEFGHPVASTNGHSIVIRRSTLCSASSAIVRCREQGGTELLPEVRTVAKTLLADAGRACGQQVEITSTTAPDAELREIALGRLAERVEVAKERLTDAHVALTQARRGSITDCRDSVRHRRSDLRHAQSQLKHMDDPRCHGVRVGEAWFDLRILRRTLRACGVSKAWLVEQGTLNAGRLLTEGEVVGLVMPFRATK